MDKTFEESLTDLERLVTARNMSVKAIAKTYFELLEYAYDLEAIADDDQSVEAAIHHAELIHDTVLQMFANHTDIETSKVMSALLERETSDIITALNTYLYSESQEDSKLAKSYLERHKISGNVDKATNTVNAAFLGSNTAIIKVINDTTSVDPITSDYVVTLPPVFMIRDDDQSHLYAIAMPQTISRTEPFGLMAKYFAPTEETKSQVLARWADLPTNHVFKSKLLKINMPLMQPDVIDENERINTNRFFRNVQKETGKTLWQVD